MEQHVGIGFGIVEVGCVALIHPLAFETDGEALHRFQFKPHAVGPFRGFDKFLAGSRQRGGGADGEVVLQLAVVPRHHAANGHPIGGGNAHLGVDAAQVNITDVAVNRESKILIER